MFPGTFRRHQVTFGVVGEGRWDEFQLKSSAGVLSKLTLCVANSGQVMVCLVDVELQHPRGDVEKDKAYLIARLVKDGEQVTQLTLLKLEQHFKASNVLHLLDCIILVAHCQTSGNPLKMVRFHGCPYLCERFTSVWIMAHCSGCSGGGGRNTACSWGPVARVV